MGNNRNTESRRGFIKKVGTLSAVYGGLAISPEMTGKGGAGAPERNDLPDLKSLAPDQLFTVLDLEAPGLGKVKSALSSGGNEAALTELLSYYRAKYTGKNSTEPKPDPSRARQALSRAADLENNTFQWGPYPAAPYGKEINWAFDPANDIEWVAAVYRFYWASDLLEAYLHTRDDRYAKTFIRLADDWIGKHPLPATLSDVHPVYTYWKGYAWLDLQTGIRATNICRAFKVLVGSPAFTPQFLGKLLASLYDHQQKTMLMPMNKVHNKAVFEQRGFVNVVYTFPEFCGSKEWLTKSMEITYANLMAQTTTDGVQREWCGGYHYGVYRDFMEIESRYREMNAPVPANYMDRVRKMADYMFYLSTPELSFPMYGDTSRPKSDKRESSGMIPAFLEAGERFRDPKYTALARGDWDRLPANGSAAFKEAGFYIFRNHWKEDQVYMALHCSPQGISSHDQPDNGTFELYAYGRWLMPDTGYYLYGRSREEREWHRNTARHATLTLDRKDSNTAGRYIAWSSGNDQDVLCVENQSHYITLLHRRTVWFVNKGANPFFVLLDEAIGDGNGNLEVHFPLAPGEIELDEAAGSVRTKFDDANLLIRVYGKSPVGLSQEEGWTSDQYGKREKRPSVSAGFRGLAPFSFVSILAPFRGKNAPECRLLTDPRSLVAGNDPVGLEVEVEGRKYVLSRKIER